MRVYFFPADEQGCGSYRMIWPAEQLKKEGLDVYVSGPNDTRADLLRAVMDGDTLVDVLIPEDADVIVLQRVSHKYIAQAVPMIRAKGVAVVVEIDDDLTCIDPRNPAFGFLQKGGQYPEHSWHNTLKACQDATLVVTSTPTLLRRFAVHGRGVVFDNYVPARYLDVPRIDHTMIGWAGSVHSHPGDLQAMGSSVSRLMQDGYSFGVVGNGEGVHRAWGLPQDTGLHVSGICQLQLWPDYVSRLGIGVAPLADTRFNASKSWLKMAEMAAVGVPCVASPRAEYARLHKERGIGLLAKDPKDWYRKLKQLADDAVMREELSEKGREAMRDMTIEGNAWRLAEILQDALNMQRA